jgi:hypothetical protein
VTYPDGRQDMVRLDDNPGLGSLDISESKNGNTE